MTIFEHMESEVRSYCRTWPVVFDRAVGSRMWSEDGRSYLDFFAGAGALNYGHNNPVLKKAVLDYLASDRVVHSLDMWTAAKRDFLSELDRRILSPRRLEYRVQFPGPGGANAVEAALKVARLATGRTGVLHFTNGFHGMTVGALAVTGNALARAGAGIPLAHATPLPYDATPDAGAAGEQPVDQTWLDRLLDDPGSGLDRPAAVIVETVQGEGGVRVARPEWLRALADRCRSEGVLLIVDDVQMGCGRTGPFFSFETAGITPDIVCLSKSIGGYGLPLALTLLRPDLDVWQPGQHSGTFRGVDPAFVAGAAAIRHYWSDRRLEEGTAVKGKAVREALEDISAGRDGVHHRGRGLVHGLVMPDGQTAARVSRAAFELGLLIETAGPRGEVLKVLPALTITEDELGEGLALLAKAVSSL